MLAEFGIPQLRRAMLGVVTMREQGRIATRSPRT